MKVVSIKLQVTDLSQLEEIMNHIKKVCEKHDHTPSFESIEIVIQK